MASYPGITETGPAFDRQPSPGDAAGPDAQMLDGLADADTAAADPRLAAHWARVRDRLQGDVGEVEFRMWLRPMTLGGVDGDEVTLLLPTRFLRDWVRGHYADKLNELWQQEDARVRRVDIRVGGAVAAVAGLPPMAGPVPAVAPAQAPCSARPRGRAEGGHGRAAGPTLRVRQLRGRQAQRVRLRLRPPGGGAAEQPGLQPAVPVWRRRPGQDAPDARHRAGAVAQAGPARPGRLHVGREVHVSLHRRHPQPVHDGVQGAAPQRGRADGGRPAVPDRQGQHAGGVLPHLQCAGGRRQADRGVRRQVPQRPLRAGGPAADPAGLRHGRRPARDDV